MNIMTRSGMAARHRALGTIYRMPPVHLPIYLHLAFLILAVTAVVLLGWVALVRQNIPPSNPFLAYAEIFPGQPGNALINLSCSSSPDTSDPAREYCTRVPENGPFWLISVTIKNRIVQRTDFAVREGTLTLGDLMFVWGRPQVRLYQKSVVFDWQHLGINGTG